MYYITFPLNYILLKKIKYNDNYNNNDKYIIYFVFSKLRKHKNME